MSELNKEHLVGGLAKEIDGHPHEQTPYAELPDKWIAKSLLQKAIRRNDLTNALRATAFLIEVDRLSFWRRLPIICWEDIGLVDLELCATVDRLAGSKRLRAKLADEEKLATVLVSKMASAAKDRSADDLLTILEHDTENPESECLQRNDYSLSDEVLETVIDPAAKLYGRLENARPADDEIQNLLSFFVDDSQQQIDIFRIGYKRTKTILPLLSAILWKSWNAGAREAFANDDFGHDHEIASVPRYAFDGNTRAGRRYLNWLSAIDSDLEQYLVKFGTKTVQQRLLRKLYYRLKSSLVSRRTDWPIGNALRQRADQIGFGLTVDQFEEGKELLALAMLRYPMSEEHL